jgi:hypothetical protein
MRRRSTNPFIPLSLVLMSAATTSCAKAPPVAKPRAADHP